MFASYLNRRLKKITAYATMLLQHNIFRYFQQKPEAIFLLIADTLEASNECGYKIQRMILLQTQIQSSVLLCKQILILPIANVFSTIFNGPYQAFLSVSNN